jgi:hypothetical protein
MGAPVAPRPAGAAEARFRVAPAPPPAPLVVAGPSGPTCRMPLWNNQERPTHLYCGAPVVRRADGVATSWCRACARRVFLPPRAAVAGAA